MSPQTLKITPPAGFEIDKTNSTFEEIVFKPIEPVLPKCLGDLKNITGYTTTGWGTNITEVKNCSIMSPMYKSLWPTRELAEASIALAQLCQLRDVYNDGWVANWSNYAPINVIYTQNNKPTRGENRRVYHVLSFKSSKLRDQFFTNFKDLLEIAKPLL